MSNPFKQVVDHMMVHDQFSQWLGIEGAWIFRGRV